MSYGAAPHRASERGFGVAAERERQTASVHIGVNHGGWGMHPTKFTVGMAILPSPNTDG